MEKVKIFILGFIVSFFGVSLLVDSSEDIIIKSKALFAVCILLIIIEFAELLTKKEKNE